MEPNDVSNHHTIIIRKNDKVYRNILRRSISILKSKIALPLRSKPMCWYFSGSTFFFCGFRAHLLLRGPCWRKLATYCRRLSWSVNSRLLHGNWHSHRWFYLRWLICGTACHSWDPRPCVASPSSLYYSLPNLIVLVRYVQGKYQPPRIKFKLKICLFV